jgi:hypothetical protein
MKPLHYWRIHARVARRLWTDISQRTRDAIAYDVEHTGEQFKWFASKVDADTQRLFEDASYYDNLEATFRYPRYQSEPLARAA